MYLKRAVKPSGRIYMTIVEKYRDPVSGKSKDKPIKVIGYADEYKDQYEDPVAHFKKLAKQMTLEAEEEKKKKLITKVIDLSEELTVGSNIERHFIRSSISQINQNI